MKCIEVFQKFVAAACFITAIATSPFVFAGPREQIAVAEAVVWANQNAEPQLTPDVFQGVAPQSAQSPMRFEFQQQSLNVTSVIRCTVHIATWCIPCHRQREENGDGDDRISFVYTTDPGPVDTIPCTTYVDARGVTRYMTGFMTTDQIWHKIQRNDPPTSFSESYSSTGPAGSIHASSEISQAMQFFREHIGENVKASLSWDRTGAQKFPLLAKGDWSTVALFGRSGRFELSAVGAKSLPVDSAAISYRVIGDDIQITLDPVLLKGLALRLGPVNGQQSAMSSPVPSTISPATILRILQVARGIWSLLHPTCDLQLGGNVSATAILSGDMLTIDFQKCPSIKLVALFTFQLSVKRVEITERNVHVEFGGSRMIKSRDFKVE